MKRKVLSVAVVFFGLISVAQAKPSVEKLTEKYHQENIDATRQYAEQAGKPIPEVIDYKYGMNIDVAKLIHTSRDIETCGSFKKLMSYEDSAGELNAIRYTLQGECVNQR